MIGTARIVVLRKICSILTKTKPLAIGHKKSPYHYGMDFFYTPSRVGQQVGANQQGNLP